MGALVGTPDLLEAADVPELSRRLRVAAGCPALEPGHLGGHDVSQVPLYAVEARALLLREPLVAELRSGIQHSLVRVLVVVVQSADEFELAHARFLSISQRM